MPEGAGSHHPSTLRDYLRVVRRRKWIIAQAVVLVPLLAVGYSLTQRKMYSASAEILLATQNVANQLNGITDPSAYQQADRRAQTQADLARVPQVAQGALAIAHVNEPVKTFLAGSSAVAETNADLLKLSVQNHNAALAQRLATAYAEAFSRYRAQLDTAPYAKARTTANERLSQMAKARQTHTGAYSDLLSKRDQLDQMIALLTQNAIPVKQADSATKIRPRPVRNGILGLALGIVLGIGLAFLMEALDTRIRSAQEIGERLGLTLLARLRAPSRRLRRENQLVMLAEPYGPQAEGFRMLRTNLEFVRLAHRAQTIVVTSATEQEGKSTTAANLSIALARAGQKVALVDLDLRRPFLGEFFSLNGGPGVTDVALGKARLGNAQTIIPLIGAGGATDSNGHGTGRLVVVSAGIKPPDPGEFVASATLARILADLEAEFDTVVIDSPPVLQVGDAAAMSAHVDALLVVVRMDVVRRPMLDELRRVLDALPAEKLGFVLTGAEQDEEKAYGAYYGYRGVYAQFTHGDQRLKETVS